MGKIIGVFKNIKNGLRFQLVISIFITIAIFITGFEIFTYQSLKNYNYNNVKTNMYSQAKYNYESYISYISNFTLSDNVNNERFQFIANAQGQIQLIDNTRTVIYDNMGSSMTGKKLETSDIYGAIKNQASYYVGVENGQKVIALSYPIMNKNTNLGIIRIVSSLEKVDEDISNKFQLFLTFGFLALLISAIFSYLISLKILKPITKLTALANKLSDGQYKEKSNMSYEGEIGELAKTMDELSDNIIHKEEIKTDFISSVSHELRTPLTSIKGWSITLQDDSIDRETVLEGLGIIEKEADRLSDMVEDLLDFSRYTSPRFNLNKTEFNIVEVTKNIVKQLKPRTEEKGIDLLVNYDTNPTIIVADENRMKQVLINLLDNAIKFTPKKGTIITNLSLKDDKFIGEVIDTGIGIGEDEINLVTTKFYKGSSSESHTGLGLSICEEIILQHKGSLEIESKLNEGTTVRFRIPIGG
ncbi:sensor histidine kinase [Peptoniphilaceae bacterium SGI.131]